MKMVFLGAGAMGSWFGGALAKAGNDVLLLTTNTAHCNAINKHGLRMQQKQLENIVQIEAMHPEEYNERADVIVLLCKTFQTKSALSSIAATLDERTFILTLQNGLGNEAKISEFVPRHQILIGNSMMPVDKIAPGIVASKGTGTTYLNAAAHHDNEEAQAVASELVEKFQKAGVDVQLDRSIEQRIWSKVAFNAGMNAVSALAHGTPGTVGESAGAQRLVDCVAEEVADVAAGCNIEIDRKAVKATIDFACKHHKDHRASMLQDLLDGKQTEVESLNAEIEALGRKFGIATPLNTLLTTLLRLAELSHQRYQSWE